MATVINPFGEEYQADAVLVTRVATVQIKVFVSLDDDDPVPWDEEDDIGEEVNDAVSLALQAARRAAENVEIEVLSVDNETVEAIDA